MEAVDDVGSKLPEEAGYAPNLPEAPDAIGHIRRIREDVYGNSGVFHYLKKCAPVMHTTDVGFKAVFI